MSYTRRCNRPHQLSTAGIGRCPQSVQHKRVVQGQLRHTRQPLIQRLEQRNAFMRDATLRNVGIVSGSMTTTSVKVVVGVNRGTSRERARTMCKTCAHSTTARNQSITTFTEWSRGSVAT